MGWFRRQFAQRPSFFLATAFFRKALSYAQCWHIQMVRTTYERCLIDPLPKVGELAVELEFLTRQEAETIEKKNQFYKGGVTQLPDPLSVRPWREVLKGLAPPFDALCLLIATAIVLTVGFRAAWDPEKIAAAAGIVGFGWVLVSRVCRSFLERHVPLHVPVRWLVLLCPPSALAWCVFLAWQLRRLAEAKTDMTDLVSTPGAADITLEQASLLWLYIWLGALVVATGLAVHLTNAWFRHRVIWHVQGRLQLMQAMVKDAHEAIQELRANTPSDQTDLPPAVREVVERVAKVVKLNPWERKVTQFGRFLKSRGPVGGVSVWYLEPDRTELDARGRPKYFDIKLCEAPAAPKEVIDAFKEIKRTHRPKSYQPEQHRQAIRDCLRRDGTLDRRKFLARGDRKNFISLTGFVFDKKQPAIDNHARRCLAVNNEPYELAREEGKGKTVLRWLDFRSLAAYPVSLTRGEQTDPVGVLLAFKTVPHGFMLLEDHEAMLTASRLIGLILHHRSPPTCLEDQYAGS